MDDISFTHLLIVLIILFCTVVFPIMAIVDVAKGPNKNKVLWIAVIFIFNFLGALLYWIFGRSARAKNSV